MKFENDKYVAPDDVSANTDKDRHHIICPPEREKIYYHSSLYIVLDILMKMCAKLQDYDVKKYIY